MAQTWFCCPIFCTSHEYIEGLVQERRNSSALAMELRLSCTNPSTWPSRYGTRSSQLVLNICTNHPSQGRKVMVQTWFCYPIFSTSHEYMTFKIWVKVKSSYMTHLPLVLNTYTAYEKDPSSGRKVMERTQFRLQKDGCMEKVKLVYPPQLCWGEGYNDTIRPGMWGTESISSIHQFHPMFRISKTLLTFTCHIHIWLVSPQLSCQWWMAGFNQ